MEGPGPGSETALERLSIAACNMTSVRRHLILPRPKASSLLIYLALVGESYLPDQPAAIEVFGAQLLDTFEAKSARLPFVVPPFPTHEGGQDR